jgi:uncharacterized iron-regulated membrane protein
MSVFRNDHSSILKRENFAQSHPIDQIIDFGLFLPLFGLSLILVGLIERLVLRQIPGLSAWLSLRPA